MSSGEHRAHSRKAQVHAYFKQHGMAAVPYGVQLGLKESTVKSWVRTWNGGSVPTVTEHKASHKRRVTWRVKQTGCDTPPVGVVIHAGEEVSEVQWESGFKEFVTNRLLKDVEV